MLKRLQAWWNSRSRKPLEELLSVEFDDAQVRVRVLRDLEAEWNQTFQWRHITRVCFKDGGMLSSDLVYVSLNDRQAPAVVPTEAAGRQTRVASTQVIRGIRTTRGLAEALHRDAGPFRARYDSPRASS